MDLYEMTKHLPIQQRLALASLISMKMTIENAKRDAATEKQEPAFTRPVSDLFRD